MEIERGRRNGTSSAHMISEGFVNGGVVFRPRDANGFMASSVSSPPPPSPPASSPRTIGSIEHRVSKLDTLAGIAIKYGVEVADIKRMNSLVTDLQMFAHKKLQIPLPGRHPPSPNPSNGSSSNGEHTPPRRRQSDLLESFQSLKLKPTQQRVSPAMSSLQGYYGLTPPKKGPMSEGTEMSVYRTGKENGSLAPISPVSEPPPSHHRKSRSLISGFLPENGELAEDTIVSEGEDNGETDRSHSEKSVRRRQKSDVDPPCRTPDLLQREENGGALSGRNGKNLAPRPRSGSRTDLDSGRLNTIPIGDSFLANGFFAVRKSSSTSDLQDSGSCSLWSTTKWTLNTDAITRPIFDGLPKPMAIRRNKAALD